MRIRRGRLIRELRLHYLLGEILKFSMTFKDRLQRTPRGQSSESKGDPHQCNSRSEISVIYSRDSCSSDMLPIWQLEDGSVPYILCGKGTLQQAFLHTIAAGMKVTYRKPVGRMQATNRTPGTSACY
jgi:hypothetical protein